MLEIVRMMMMMMMKRGIDDDVNDENDVLPLAEGTVPSFFVFHDLMKKILC